MTYAGLRLRIPLPTLPAFCLITYHRVLLSLSVITSLVLVT